MKKRDEIIKPENAPKNPASEPHPQTMNLNPTIPEKVNKEITTLKRYRRKCDTRNKRGNHNLCKST